jgi:hypothetical protein
VPAAACPTWVAWATSDRLLHELNCTSGAAYGPSRFSSPPTPPNYANVGSMTRGRYRFGALAAAVAFAALGACGGSTVAKRDAPPKVVVTDPVAKLAASADATTAARSAHLTATMTIDADVFPKPLTFALDGTTTLDGSRAEMQMDMSSLLSTMPGAAGRKIMVEMRLVDGVEYMKFGDLLAALGTGDTPPSFANVKWLKLDLSALQGAAAGGTSPNAYTQYLEYLRGASSGHVRTLGRVMVRGVRTTHYQADIDKAKLADRIAKLRAKLAPELRALVEKGLQGVADDMTIDVWIGDSDGLVHRLSMSVGMKLAGVDANMAITEDFSDFGVAVDVVAPPPAQVKSFSDLSGLARTTSA